MRIDFSEKNIHIYFFVHLYLTKIFARAIRKPKNSMKVIIEAPKANPNQPPIVAGKRMREIRSYNQINLIIKKSFFNVILQILKFYRIDT